MRLAIVLVIGAALAVTAALLSHRLWCDEGRKVWREALAVLDHVAPIPLSARDDLARFEARAGRDDVDATRWRNKLDRCDALAAEAILDFLRRPADAGPERSRAMDELRALVGEDGAIHHLNRRLSMQRTEGLMRPVAPEALDQRPGSGDLRINQSEREREALEDARGRDPRERSDDAP